MNLTLKMFNMRVIRKEPTEFDLLNMFVMEMEHGANRKLIRLDVDDVTFVLLHPLNVKLAI